MVHFLSTLHTNALLGVSMRSNRFISWSFHHPHKHTPFLAGRVLRSSLLQCATTQASTMYVSIICWGLWRELVSKRCIRLTLALAAVYAITQRILEVTFSHLWPTTITTTETVITHHTIWASHLQGWGSLLKRTTSSSIAYRLTAERVHSTITTGVPTLCLVCVSAFNGTLSSTYLSPQHSCVRGSVSKKRLCSPHSVRQPTPSLLR